MPPTAAGLRWVRPPQQARSQETLHRILDAAEELIGEKGFEDAAVAEMARRADSSVGGFYARFRDKEALLHAVYERYLEQAVATADEALDPERWRDADIPRVLSAVVRFLVEIFRERRGLIRAFVVRNHADAEFMARRERLSSHVNDRLSALLLARRAQISHPDPERAAAFGLTLVFSTLESVILFGEMRFGALALGDDELAAELTLAYLAYLGIQEDLA